MTINRGSRLGPYEIIESIGAGGMGEVWRARDTRLDREVAIKVLPPGFAENEQFLQRFEREARTISSLNHPHVCTLYDVGEASPEREGDPAGTTHYLVMELLEGETLADRLKKGPLPLPQVLKYGQQIAAALDAAHRKGVVHRDLKPGNVMITKSGAKLLDFGLAKAASEGFSPIDGLTNLPTEARPLTQEGTILGTFQYMAPEQLEGIEADARTDIFAFGALLYEMATGKRAFAGQTKTSLIASIVSSQPEPISQVAPMSPPALDHVVRRCLEKDPDDRWQSAHDVAGELAWISEAGSQAGVGRAVASSRRTRIRATALIAAIGWLAALGALGWIVVKGVRGSEADRPLLAELVNPGVTPVTVGGGTIVLAPDGSSLAIASGTGDAICVRDFATGKISPLAGTEGATYPFWSPDGRWLGFMSGGKLKKIDVRRGTIQTLADAPQGRGGSWGEGDVIVFAPTIYGPMEMVRAAGGATEPLGAPDGEFVTHRNPHFLPGGTVVLYIRREGRRERYGSIWAAALGGGELRKIVEDASNPQFANGYLFWVRENSLMAQQFDPSSLELSGSPRVVVENVEYNNPRDIGNFSVVDSMLAWRREQLVPLRIVKVGFDGKEIDSWDQEGLFGIEDLSSDGRNLLLTQTEPSRAQDLWVLDLNRRQLSRSTFLSTNAFIGGVISDDGSRVAVTTWGEKGWDGARLWVQPLLGGGAENVIAENVRINATDWSPDERYVVGGVQDAVTGWDVAYIEMENPEASHVVLRGTPFNEVDSSLSPDGRWLSYVSDESGRLELYVTDFPDGRNKWQVSSSGSQGFRGTAWSRDSSRIYYWGEERLMEADLRPSSDQLDPGVPRPTNIRSSDYEGQGGFAVASDGVILARPASQSAPEPLRLLSHWRGALVDPE